MSQPIQAASKASVVIGEGRGFIPAFRKASCQLMLACASSYQVHDSSAFVAWDGWSCQNAAFLSSSTFWSRLPGRL